MSKGMKESAQIEAMAKFEYWRDVEWRNGRAYGNNAATWSKCVPDYLHDHNAVQMVIDGLDEDTVMQYIIELSAICKRDNPQRRFTMYATCPQKVEAILRATGKWQPKEPTMNEENKQE